MISWLRYNPAKEISKLRIPVLIMQGTKDLQTPLADGKGLAEGNPAAKLLLIDGMNHVLKTVSNNQEQVSSYSDPARPVAPDLVNGIRSFVSNLRGRHRAIN
jgi:fermentation-respiration switch protein FrsA (DUF1100 family)